MKKRFCVFLVALCMCLGLLQPDMTVWAATGTTSLSVSGSNVNIGDTITVSAKASGPSGEQVVATMTLSWDSSVLQFVSCSTTYGGGGSSVTVATDSFNVTLKAVAAGTSSISLSGTDGFSYDDAVGELDSVSGSSTSVTVNNAAGGSTGGSTTGGTSTGGTSTGGTTAGDNAAAGTTAGTTTGNESGGTQSADNSLKSLTISPGTLSPAFSGKTTSYTATVGSDVTSIAVTAVPVNVNAVVESVTGNDNLQTGVNTIKIVVKAENGVTATYTIKVTRQAGDAQAEEPEEIEEETPESTETTTGEIMINGVSYAVAEDFAAEDIPADFSENTVSYHGNDYKGVSFNKGTLNMLWMKQADVEDAEGRFYIYDESRDALYSFVKMGNDTRYVIAILAPADVTMPETCVQTSLMVDGENSITAYQQTSEETAETVSDFYIFYGINHDGTAGWYQYDALEGTYQRLATAITLEETAGSSDIEYLQEQYAELSEKHETESAKNRSLIAVLIFIVAVLVIIIINLLVHRFRKPDDYDNDDMDGDDDTYDDSYEDELEMDSDSEDELDKLEEETEPVRRAAPAPKEKKRDSQKTTDDIEVIDFNDL